MFKRKTTVTVGGRTVKDCLGSFLNISDKTLYLFANCKINNPPAPELCRQSFCPTGIAYQSIYHTKTCWLSRKLNSKLLTPSSGTFTTGNTQESKCQPFHLSHGLFIHMSIEELGNRFQRNLATYHKSASAGQTGVCHQDVDFFKKTKQLPPLY